MATISPKRASYQHVNNIDQRPICGPTLLKVLKDIETQSALVASSKTSSQYNLRITRLRALVLQLPKSL